MATGPAAVNSCEPILHPPTVPSSRSSSASASSRRSTSSATSSRSEARGLPACSDIGVVLLQAPDLLLALEQRLDRADGRLGPVQREVVRNVPRHRGTADLERVPARAPVLRRVEDELDVALLHEVDDVG